MKAIRPPGWRKSVPPVAVLSSILLIDVSPEKPYIYGTVRRDWVYGWTVMELPSLAR